MVLLWSAHFHENFPHGDASEAASEVSKEKEEENLKRSLYLNMGNEASQVLSNLGSLKEKPPLSPQKTCSFDAHQPLSPSQIKRKKLQKNLHFVSYSKIIFFRHQINLGHCQG